MSEPLDCFATSAPGLEPTLEAELIRLGIAAKAEDGGAAWRGDLRSVYSVNLHARTASRVLVRAAVFRARTFFELERHARRVPWARFLAGGREVRLRVTSRKSKLYHEGAVAERLLGAIQVATGVSGGLAMGEDSEGDDAATQLFVVRLLRDTCTISADASGELLHRRGYRQALAKAPLRETLAAAMLQAADWGVSAPLLDPLCGSGTVAIEAALLARRIPPALARADREPRDFACLHWPDARPDIWADLVDAARDAILERCPAPVYAADHNAGAIRAARGNAERAGLAGDIELSVRALEDAEPPAPAGWLVTNPPYGVRAGDRRSAAAVRERLLAHAAGSFRDWSVGILEPVALPLPADFASRFETRNGGIAVRFALRSR